MMRSAALGQDPDESKDEELCVHGMSAWLCMGPMHYPSMQDEMEGRYF